jgi:hypothetical protein
VFDEEPEDGDAGFLREAGERVEYRCGFYVSIIIEGLPKIKRPCPLFSALVQRSIAVPPAAAPSRIGPTAEGRT